jgi:hypothetical protein
MVDGALPAERLADPRVLDRIRRGSVVLIGVKVEKDGVVSGNQVVPGNCAPNPTNDEFRRPTRIEPSAMGRRTSLMQRIHRGSVELMVKITKSANTVHSAEVGPAPEEHGTNKGMCGCCLVLVVVVVVAVLVSQKRQAIGGEHGAN